MSKNLLNSILIATSERAEEKQLARDACLHGAFLCVNVGGLEEQGNPLTFNWIAPSTRNKNPWVLVSTHLLLHLYFNLMPISLLPRLERVTTPC
jgi:hypothetical protein